MIFTEKNKENFFSREKTTVLKGICISFVFLHHIAQYLSIGRFVRMYLMVGPMAVDVFFFLAGYAMLYKMEATDTDYKRFAVDRALRLYMPISLLLITFSNFLDGLIWMYIGTFAAYRFFKSRFRIPFIFLWNILFIVLCMKLGLGSFWYDRILPYSFGALFFKTKDQIIPFLRSRKICALAFFSSWIIAICFAWKAFGYTPFYMLYSIIYSFSLSVATVVSCYMFGITSKVFSFLGK